MKNLYEVLHTHEQRIVHLRREIEALRLVAKLLDEDEMPNTFPANAPEGGGGVVFPVSLER